jgi:hypothetical protein
MNRSPKPNRSRSHIGQPPPHRSTLDKTALTADEAEWEHFIASLVGEPVRAAWILPSSPVDVAFIAQLAGGIELICEGKPAGVLSITRRAWDPEWDVRFLDRYITDELSALVGRPFAGIDGQVVMFKDVDGAIFGVSLGPGRADWVDRGGYLVH